MDKQQRSLLIKGYIFLARNIAAGIIVNKILDFLAWSDYRILILLSMWHPDNAARVKYLRKRGVKVGENVFVDLGVFIEITTPLSVIIEDYAAIGYGATIYAHDASLNQAYDLPMRVKTTHLKWNCAVGARAMVMPGVTVGEGAGVAPGAVAVKDVPDMTVVGGNPAEPIMKIEDLVKGWQADMRAHPQYYYDNPKAVRPPKTIAEEWIHWREEGLEINDAMDLRTGTPFDYILDYKKMKRTEKS
jgi:acetyltransferase-like isoleucine patch superfamily enzyme